MTSNINQHSPTKHFINEHMDAAEELINQGIDTAKTIWDEPSILGNSLAKSLGDLYVQNVGGIEIDSDTGNITHDPFGTLPDLAEGAYTMLKNLAVGTPEERVKSVATLGSLVGAYGISRAVGRVLPSAELANSAPELMEYKNTIGQLPDTIDRFHFTGHKAEVAKQSVDRAGTLLGKQDLAPYVDHVAAIEALGVKKGEQLMLGGAFQPRMRVYNNSDIKAKVIGLNTGLDIKTGDDIAVAYHELRHAIHDHFSPAITSRYLNGLKDPDLLARGSLSDIEDIGYPEMVEIVIDSPTHRKVKEYLSEQVNAPLASGTAVESASIGILSLRSSITQRISRNLETLLGKRQQLLETKQPTKYIDAHIDRAVRYMRNNLDKEHIDSIVSSVKNKNISSYLSVAAITGSLVDNPTASEFSPTLESYALEQTFSTVLASGQALELKDTLNRTDILDFTELANPFLSVYHTTLNKPIVTPSLKPNFPSHIPQLKPELPSHTPVFKPTTKQPSLATKISNYFSDTIRSFHGDDWDTVVDEARARGDVFVARRDKNDLSFNDLKDSLNSAWANIKESFDYVDRKGDNTVAARAHQGGESRGQQGIDNRKGDGGAMGSAEHEPSPSGNRGAI